MQLITRKPIRLKNYDYSLDGYYFVTICSKDRENIFGQNKIIVGEGLASSRHIVQLSELGHLIENQWRSIPTQIKNVELDEYIIMPNHIHGILKINNHDQREDARPSPTIVDVICSFKSKCTVEYLKFIKNNNLNVSGKIWQRSFYDHIIRDEKSLDKIREYIIKNPDNWLEDEENLKK